MKKAKPSKITPPMTELTYLRKTANNANKPRYVFVTDLHIHKLEMSLSLATLNT